MSTLTYGLTYCMEATAHHPMRPVEVMHTDTDAELLARVRSGNHAAFSLLVRRHTPRFYRLARRFCGQQAEAEDIVQQAFLKLWQNPAIWQANRNTAFTTWFYRVIVNLCYDYRKKKRPAELEHEANVADDSATHEERLLAEERQRLLEHFIQALPERQRMALMLCFYEGLSNAEAATIMGVRLKALQSLLIRAKTALKLSLKARMGSDDDDNA